MRLRYAVVLATLLALPLAFAPHANAATGFSATLLGANEVPPNPSTGTGSAVLILDNTATSLSYTVTYSGLVAPLTASHIHKAPIGVNGGVLFGFAPPIGTTSGTFSGVVSGLTAANVSDLLAGLYYVNIHSTTYSGGELRGQIGGAPTPTGKSTWGRIKSLYR